MKYIVFGIILCATVVICEDTCSHLAEDICCKTDGCAFANCSGQAGAQCVNQTTLHNLNCSDDVCSHGVVTSIAPTENVTSTITPDVTSATEGPITKGENNTTEGPTTTEDVTTVTSASVTTATSSPTTGIVTHHAGDNTTTTNTTTEAMTTTLPSPSCPGGQHFDAASFIGGIVLCGGLLSIIFFGCKFYKARSEKNYHQF